MEEELTLVTSSLDEATRADAGALLQETLADLVDLSLLAKQAWFQAEQPTTRSGYATEG